MTKYENQIPTSMNMSLKAMLSMLRDSLKSGQERRPLSDIPIVKSEFSKTVNADNHPQVTWFGHSAFLLEMEGTRLLFDPMLGNRPSPVSWVGTKRYNVNLPVQPEELPPLDAIILSHDHYDHLDYSSIRRLMNKTERFIVPVGVRRRLIQIGVPSDKITEHAWWDELQFKGLTLACTPARHFSGRGLFDRNSTLWCSWMICGQETKVFFSGDSGYGPHFKEIGDKYGPFDLTMMECGQYDERWANIHMMPEETVQAHLDVKGKLLIPIHWGAFTLAYHAWTDPVERITRAARNAHIEIATPKIGEKVQIHTGIYPMEHWWKSGF